MPQKYRIPITAITVFGTSSLLAIAVAIVLYLGLSQAAKSTRQLWADQAKTLIDAMEDSLDTQLKPIREQARWVANGESPCPASRQSALTPIPRRVTPEVADPFRRSR